MVKKLLYESTISVTVVATGMMDFKRSFYTIFLLTHGKT